MATTAIHSLPYPLTTDNVDVPGDIKALANGLDPALPVVSDTQPSAPVNGTIWYAPTAKVLSLYDGSTWIAYHPAVVWQYTKTAAQSFANNTFGTVLMDTADIDTANLGVTTTGSYLGGFPCPVKGIYRCSGAVAFAGNTTGRRGTLFQVNANGLQQTKTLQAATTAGAAVVPAAASIVAANAGDVISMQVFQDSGTTLALATPNGATLTVELVQQLQ